MELGPILQRELVVLVRRRRAHTDRLISLAMGAAVLLGCGWAWDRWGWDRSSIAGASRFALMAFGLMVTVQADILFGLVVAQVAAAIASERDKKSLDALLATRLSAAEIVFGTMAMGLVRWGNGLAAVLPVLLVLMGFGGIDLRLVLLATLGLASTGFLLAAIAVVASVHARTARRAIASAILIAMAWLIVPEMVVLLKPRLWPTGPTWLVTAAVGLLSSSPVGVAMNLSGVVRLGTPLQAILRMIACEVLGGSLLAVWAAWRLRPASRAHYDDETRIAGLKILRAAKRHHPRPPCGDDPVLWNAIHSNRSANLIARLLGYLIGLGYVGVIVLGMAWFAVPAFRELADRGYGAAPEAFAGPEGNQLARAVVSLLVPSTGSPAPGQARLEFNLALRTFSAGFGFFVAFAVLVGAMESLLAERERDTWSGLLTTPLSGWEIVRAKMLGVLHRLRGALILQVGLWTVGLLAGSIHPLGFLASFVGLVATAGCFAALGVSIVLRTRDRSAAMNLGALLPFLLAAAGLAIQFPGRASVLLSAASPPFLAFSAPFSYEDIQTMIHGGILPTYAGPTSIQPGLGARWVLAAWLLGTAAQAAGALFLIRAICRTFDQAVGRPTRAHATNRASGDPAPTLSSWQAGSGQIQLD